MQKLNDGLAIAGELTIKTYKDGVLLRTIGPFKNKVVSSAGYGRNLILRAVAGDTSLPTVINSAAIGTGTVPPVDADTGLGTPVISGLGITSMSVANNVLTIDVFVTSATLTNGTYAEFGFFATSRLISRVLITPSYTKATGEDSLFTYTLTLAG